MTDVNAVLTEIGTEVKTRLTAVEESIAERLSDQEIERRIRSMFPDVLESLSKEDSDTGRKIRGWASPTDQELVGTKYARLGMNVQDVEMLHNVLTAAYERGHSKRGPSEELTRTFEAVSKGYYRSTALARADDERALERARDAGRLDEVGYQRAMHAVRAMDTAESGFGSQLIGAQYVGDLWEAARRQSRVFNLLESFEMTEATTYLPVEVDIPEMLYVGESTEANSADYATVKTGSQRVQVTPKKFVIHQIFSTEMEEDSIIPYVPFLRRQAGLSMEHYSDSVVLNGDTTDAANGNINLDDADPAGTKHYLSLDGLRHAWLVDNTNNAKNMNGAINWNALNTVRNLMIDDTNITDWGNPTMDADLVYVADPRTATAISLLPEVLTKDKYGEGATVLNGEISRIGRHPLVVSQAMRLTEADGKISTTGSNNTLGQVQVFNRNGFKVAWRRRVVMETEKLVGRDQTRLIWSLRFDFARFTPTGAASGIEAAAGIYNIVLP